MPEWLRGVEEAQPEEELPEQPSISPLSEAEGSFDQTQDRPAPVPSAATELPEWLRGIDEAQPEEDSEETRASLPAWLQSEYQEEEPHPAPTTAADWHPAEPQSEPSAQEPEPEVDMSQPPISQTMQPAIDMGQPTPPSPNVYEPPSRPTPVQKPSRTTRIKQVETSQASAEIVNQAKEELNRGDIPTAVNHYTKLIKKGKHLDEAIRDLRESLYRYPVEVSIWQTLGDAYMRANRLQDALDAYNKAEELLR
jgi:tetratricopeptide (TPR) repeat protein